jgi:hypothetical protein
MHSWRAATPQEVNALLADALRSLTAAHRVKFDQIRVPVKAVPLASDPGSNVCVVAEFDRKVVYWSDIEEGWELAELDALGRVPERGSNQYELSHLAEQLWGAR